MTTLIEGLLAVALMAQPAAPPEQSKPAEPPGTAVAPVVLKQTSPSDDVPVEERLLKVKRIFVESFGDDIVSKQVQAMVVSSLTQSKKFIVTENRERADAVLKGSGLEKTSQEVHAYSDSTAAGGAAGGHSGSVSGNWVNGTGSVSGSSSGGFVSRAAAISDSSLNTETVNDARIAVRLVDRDGDVIWTTTQESKGAKYKSATADIADNVVKQLVRDLDKAAKKLSTPSSAK